VAAIEFATPRVSQRAFVTRRLVRSPGFVIGGLLVLVWVGSAFLWRWFVPHDPNAVDPLNALQPPSWDHLFGTDDLGRDVFSRVFAGAASVLAIATVVTFLCVCAGAALGLVTGYYRGIVDDVLMRLIDALISLPAIVISVVVLGLLGPSTVNVVLVIACLFTPYVTRTIRSAVLVERESGYVEAARLRGESPLYIMWRELAPNIAAPVLVEATIRFGFAVFAVSALSFLGLGLQRPSPDWGLTIALESTFLQVAPWPVLFPALALASLLIGVNLAADALQGILNE
jgi:peptide/nickel transport system permease protein